MLNVTLADADWAECERVIRDFESTWRGPRRPILSEFLPSETPYPLRLLTELVHVDLEFRIRMSEPARVEEYAERYPGLSEPNILLDLIASEYRLRSRYGQKPLGDEYRQRFPDLKNELAELLSSAKASQATAPRGASSGFPTGKPVIAGYVIGPPLGSGGMGVVYQADQPKLSRTVAIKTLANVPSRDALNRFHREAETVARLDHRHIVPIYEVGAWEVDGLPVPYFVMKWYPGGSLDAIPCGSGTDHRAHAELIESVALAIQHAHERGVLHRDLKPSNILLDDRGEPCVADFGLAGWYNSENPKPMTAAVVGTPSYMSPEQADDPAGVTTAADIYGLGAVLYHLLTGKPPFQAETALATLKLAADQPVESPSSVNSAIPRDLATICLKCLEKSPAHRYRSAQELAEDLGRWRTGRPIVARSATNIEKAWRLARRHPLASALAGATAAALAALMVVLIVSNARIRFKEAETASALSREQQLLYLERVAAANQYYHSNHVEQAWRMLDLCPEHLRKWEWQYMDRVRRSSGGLSVLQHNDAVLNARFLPDDRTVTAERGGAVRVWSASGNPQLLPIKGSFLKTHPKRNLVAARYVDPIGLNVYDVDRKKVVLHQPLCEWYDFTPDGSHLVTGHHRDIRFFDTETWQETESISNLPSNVAAVAISEGGSTLYVASFDYGIRVIDRETKKIRSHWHREHQCTGLVLTPDGLTLIEMYPSKLAFLDLEKAELRRPMETITVGRPKIVPASQIDQFVTTGAMGEILIRDLDPNVIHRSYHGHTGKVFSISINTDKSRVVSAGDDGTARIWDITRSVDHVDVATFPDEAGTLSMAPDGRRIAVGTPSLHALRPRTAAVIDLTTGQTAFTLPAAGDVAFDPNGRWLAAGQFALELFIFDARDGSKLRTLPSTEIITKLAFSPNGNELLAIDFRGKVSLWDTQTWTLIDRPQLREAITSWAWTNDGARLAIAVGAEIRILDGHSYQLLQQIPTARPPTGCYFDNSGQYLAVVHVSRPLELYDVATGKLKTVFIGATSAHGLPTFHPNGGRLATSEIDGAVRVWDTETGREVLMLDDGRSGTFASVLWSKDGQRIYGAGTTLRRWGLD